jgi:hypothetical protein
MGAVGSRVEEQASEDWGGGGVDGGRRGTDLISLTNYLQNDEHLIATLHRLG